jgi:hypothetical protein
MADYKELLRRAISALPENNGAARRAVYEKARAALVGQLRAITPPLPARDITQHRLQLEDCIRQVEQEASEAIISLGREQSNAFRDLTSARQSAPVSAPAAPAPAPVETAPPPPPPPPVEPPAPQIIEKSATFIAPEPEPVVAVEPAPEEPAPTTEAAPAETSIEDIISQAASVTNTPVTLVEDEGEKPESERVVPPVVETPKPFSNVRPFGAPKSPSFEARRDPLPLVGASRHEPVLGNQAVALQPQPEVEPTISDEPALSSVREVDVEADPEISQDYIERAIETLDREARGQTGIGQIGIGSLKSDAAPLVDDDAGFASVDEPKGGNGLTIFLAVFVVLLALVGGGGYWAWREGYLNPEQMFGTANTPAPTEVPTAAPVPAPADPSTVSDAVDTEPSGPGNATPSNTTVDDRLEPTPEPVVPNGTESVLPSIGSSEIKTDDRLPTEDAASATSNDPATSVDPAVLAGSQSLLLEASTDGSTGAVPFSGTVDWSEGVDDIGQPTLKATASIPARNLSVDVTIRKNSDPVLPASHLMEIDFKVSDTFIGGTIANLPGVLLKDRELVAGKALIGASARVVGNSFLFALSAAPADEATNSALLKDNRWIDLAVVYGTGRNAILTLEKDEEAQALFNKVLADWAN